MNQDLDDIRYCIFKERILIQANYLEFIHKQQEEFNRLYEKKLLYEMEIEKIFMDSLRDSNQAQEKLSRQQLELLDQLHQKIADMLKLIEDKINNLKTIIGQYEGTLKTVNIELSSAREKYINRIIGKFQNPLSDFMEFKFDLKLPAGDILTVNITEKDFQEFGVKLGRDYRSKNLNESDLLSLVNSNMNELMRDLLEKKLKSKYSSSEKGDIYNFCVNGNEFKDSVLNVKDKFIKMLFHDNEFKNNFDIAREKFIQKNEIENAIQSCHDQINILEEKISFAESLKDKFDKSIDMPVIESGFNLLQFLEFDLKSPGAAQADVQIPSFTNLEELTAINENLLSLTQNTEAGESAFQSALSDLTQAEATAQLSTDSTDFNVNDFLASLSDISATFSATTSELATPSQPPEFHPEPAPVEETASTTYKPGR